MRFQDNEFLIDMSVYYAKMNIILDILFISNLVIGL